MSSNNVLKTGKPKEKPVEASSPSLSASNTIELASSALNTSATASSVSNASVSALSSGSTPSSPGGSYTGPSTRATNSVLVPSTPGPAPKGPSKRGATSASATTSPKVSSKGPPKGPSKGPSKRGASSAGTSKRGAKKEMPTSSRVLRSAKGVAKPTVVVDVPKTDTKPAEKVYVNPKKVPVVKDVLINETQTQTVENPHEAKKARIEPVSVKILSWNVGGLRALIKKKGVEELLNTAADVICLQEIRCPTEDLPAEVVDITGYHQYWVESESKAGYAGCSTWCKQMPLSVTTGIKDAEMDQDGRVLTVEFPTFYVVNVYVPNAGRKLVTLGKRLKWNTAFEKFCRELDALKPLVIVGDMNVAHAEIDLARPKANVRNAGFTKEERNGMTEFLAKGYVDTYRHLNPTEVGYTFWSYMGGAREKNVGWRLDYFIVSERFLPNVSDSIICSQVMGSDHCPIVLLCEP